MTSLPVDGTRSPLPTEAEHQLRSSVLKPLEDLRRARQEAAWASWAEGEYTKCKNARQPYERQWYINIAFYKGRHYIAPINVPGAGFRLVAPKAPPWRVRMVINKIRIAVRTETSKLTSSKPMPTVIPATNEDEDFAAARIAEQILKSQFHDPEFDKTIRNWVWWGVVTGNAYLKSYWDASAIDEMAQEAPQPGPMGTLIEPEPIYGKVCIENINPLQIYVPDTLCTSIEEQPYVIHVTTKSPLWVEKYFGFKATPDARTANSITDAAMFSSQNQQLDAVIVKEMWLKPYAHPDFPQGGVLTIINGRCVQVKREWPWPFKEYPFYKYDGIPTGEFFTESVVTDLIPVQKEYNRTKSQMIEIKNLMGKPKIMYPRGSINPRQISSEPGQGIPYTPGMGDKPTIIPGVEVPASMHVELDRLSADFDDISGQHEITRGNTPSQVTSGTAIAFLQEQDDSKLAYQVAGIEHAIQKLGRHFLKFVATYWTETRLVRVVGRDNDFEAQHWRGSDLRGNTDVRVQAGSALPYSKAAKAAMLTEFMQNGWIAPQDGLEMMDMNGLDKIMEEFLIDKRAAQRENMRMAEAPVEVIAELLNPPVGIDGQPVMGPDPQGGEDEIPYDPMTEQPWQPQPPMPINSWDNHEAHIQFHNQFRKSQQFELLDDAIKQMFELHIQAHQMTLMMPQMGAAGIVNGPPTPPGEEGEEGTEGGIEPPPQEQSAPTQ